MVHHVALETRERDVEAETAFWSLLGFERVDPPVSLRGRTTWLQQGGQQIHLLWADDPVVAPQGHVAIVAGDFDRDTRALREAGHDVQDRPPHWDAARCSATTPAGHRVEVMAAPPA